MITDNATAKTEVPRYVQELASGWARNVTGGMVVALLAFATASVTIAGRVWQWPSWLSIDMGIVTFCWFFLSLPIAAYRLWLRDQESLRKLQDELQAATNTRTPYFKASLLAVMWDVSQAQGKFVFIAVLNIINLGAGAGIGQYRVRLKRRGGNTIQAHIVAPLHTQRIVHSDGTATPFDAADLLTGRVTEFRTNIPVVGTLLVMCDDLRFDEGREVFDVLSLQIGFSVPGGAECWTARWTTLGDFSPALPLIYPGLPLPVRR